MKCKYPRVEPIYPLYQLNKERFRVGAQLRITIEFDDDEGRFWTLPNLLDGVRSFDEVVAGAKRKYPELTVKDIEEGIDFLNDEGPIEETFPGRMIGDRYLANMSYFSRYCKADDDRFEIQGKIDSLRILLLGLGGGGSNILTLLAGFDPRMIRMVNYDRTEASNLGRQLLHREADTGEKKTVVTKRATNEMNLNVNVETVDKEIIDVDDVVGLTEGIDIIVCAIDEPPSLIYRIVNEAIVKVGLPYMFGTSQISRGRVYTVVPQRTRCSDCTNLNFSKNDPKFAEQFVGFRNIQFTPPSIVYGPDILQLTASIVGELIRVVTRYAEPKSLGTQYEINYEDGNSSTHRTWPRSGSECPTCGKRGVSQWEVLQCYQEEK